MRELRPELVVVGGWCAVGAAIALAVLPHRSSTVVPVPVAVPIAVRVETRAMVAVPIAVPFAVPPAARPGCPPERHDAELIVPGKIGEPVRDVIAAWTNAG